MAYEFSPDQDVDVPKSDSEGGQVIEFALGFDPETDLIVVMAVLLTGTDRPDTLELHFGLRARLADGSATGPDYSKECVAQYIPKVGRDLVKGLIIEAVKKLVLAAGPEYILMETYYAHLEARALEKYEPVCGAVIVSGYRIVDHWREENGKDYWIFNRN